MAVKVTTIFDGQTYYPGQSLPDLGSWVCTSVDRNDNGELNIRNYEGLSADVSKLPKYETGLGTGSSALCLDTGDFYKYEKSTDTWYKIDIAFNSGNSGGTGEIGEGYAYLVGQI